MHPRTHTLAALVAASIASSPVLANGTVNVVALDVAPTLDGDASDWAGVSPINVPLRQTKEGGKSAVAAVEVRAGVHGDEVFLLLRWKDSTEDRQHKPFVWSDAESKYVSSGRAEDRLALQFAMSGQYTTDWLSGNTFTADMWHWKAHRSNELGLVHDKMTIVGKEPVKKAYEAKARDGSTVYIRRPGDAGGKLYKSKRYITKDQQEMPKYILNPDVSGSVADIKAKGVWKDGMWTLEIRRKLDTGHPDDVVFTPGEKVAAGFAVFDRTGDDDHNVSDVLVFQF